MKKTKGGCKSASHPMEKTHSAAKKKACMGKCEKQVNNFKYLASKKKK